MRLTVSLDAVVQRSDVPIVRTGLQSNTSHHKKKPFHVGRAFSCASGQWHMAVIILFFVSLVLDASLGAVVDTTGQQGVQEDGVECQWVNVLGDGLVASLVAAGLDRS